MSCRSRLHYKNRGNAPGLRSVGEDGLTTASEFQGAMYAEGVEKLGFSAIPSSDVRLHVPGHVVDGGEIFLRDQGAPAEGAHELPAGIFP